jgi:hypothetical protein
VEVPEWSHWCALHDAYERINGGALTHEESASAPGYTPEGARAGANSVLSAGQSWDAGNPWETAPIHLHQLLAPRLNAMGVDDSGGFTCATTLLSVAGSAPAVDTVYVYPGEGVRHRFEETAAESPTTPGQLVGIPAATKTGPYLYASIDGPRLHARTRARMTAGTLVGPDGPVEVRSVDNYTPGLEGAIPPGGELIPLLALRPRSSYTAYVRFEFAPPLDPMRVVERTWSFVTRGLDPQTSIDVDVGSGRHGEGVNARLQTRSSASATIRATRPATGEVRSTTVRAGERKELGLPAGRWRLCVGQPATGDYEAHVSCREEPVDVPLAMRDVLRLQPAKRTRTKMRIPIHVAPALAGRRLDVTILALRVHCLTRQSRPSERCRHTPRWDRKRRRTLVASPVVWLTVARPAGFDAVSIRVRSKALVAGDVIVRAANVEGHYHR